MFFAYLFGYIDPFSGTVLLQVLIAGTVACAAFFRKSLSRAARFITGRTDTTARTRADRNSSDRKKNGTVGTS